jgi:hypothetical protein
VDHFVNASGTRISNAIIKGGIGQSMTIGVYGAVGMNVGPNDSRASGRPSGGRHTLAPSTPCRDACSTPDWRVFASRVESRALSQARSYYPCT